jgi:hypothetical protein
MAHRYRGDKLRVADKPATPSLRQASMTWAQRLKRIFNIEIGNTCDGAMKVSVYL